jgi:hypothetical protein
MANVYAVKTGNWSDTTVWNTGTLPATGDAVFSNNYTVTVDGTFTVASISNQAQSPAVAGGVFKFANGADLTALVQATATTNYIVNFDLSSPNSATLRGMILNGADTIPGHGGYSGSNGAANVLVAHTGTGTFTIIGNVVLNAKYHSRLVVLSGTGILNVIGNVYGLEDDTNAVAPILSNASSGTINITGSVTAYNSNNSTPCSNLSNGTINIVGTVTGGIVGYGAWNRSTGIINITGNCVGGSGVNGFAFYNDSSGSIAHIGTLTASASNPAAGGTTTGICYLSGPFIGTAQGVAANAAYKWRWIPSVGSTYMTVANSTASGYKNLYTADNVTSSSGQPSVSNVRSGTIYGPTSEFTGTCAVPAAGSVALGVPVDATTGTAVLTIDAVKQGCSKAVVPALIALG